MKYQKKYKPALWKSIKDASAAATASSNGDAAQDSGSRPKLRVTGMSRRSWIKSKPPQTSLSGPTSAPRLTKPVPVKQSTSSAAAHTSQLVSSEAPALVSLSQQRSQRQQCDTAASSSQSGTTRTPSRSRPVRPVSKRSLPRRRQYTVDAREWKLKNPWCHCCGLIFQRKPKAATSVHHSRGRVGSLLLDQRFWKAACDECHEYIHHNPSIAQALGLFCRMGRWNTPPKRCQCDGCGCRVADGVLECGACLMERKHV